MNDPLGASTISLDDQNGTFIVSWLCQAVDILPAPLYEGPYMDYLSIPPVALSFPDTLDYLNPRNSMVEASVQTSKLTIFIAVSDV